MPSETGVNGRLILNWQEASPIGQCPADGGDALADEASAEICIKCRNNYSWQSRSDRDPNLSSKSSRSVLLLEAVLIRHKAKRTRAA